MEGPRPPLRDVRGHRRHPRARGRHRHRLLRGDEEGRLLHDELPPPAPGHHEHALLRDGGQGRRHRHLLRPLGHGQDDALGRPDAAAHRRRRAWVGRRWRLQPRGRVLREDDRPQPREGAVDPRGDPQGRAPREHRGGRERQVPLLRRLAHREHPRVVPDVPHPEPRALWQGRSRVKRHLPDVRRVRSAPARLEAHDRAGALPPRVRVHRQGRRDRAGHYRADNNILDVLRRRLHAPPRQGVRNAVPEEDREARRERVPRQHRVDGRGVRRREAHGHCGDAPDRVLDPRRVDQRRGVLYARRLLPALEALDAQRRRAGGARSGAGVGRQGRVPRDVREALGALRCQLPQVLL
mmetsp:Transcript_13261/g.30648  ORF Transcript_13261/g.30648 Transcript_13261/m.30648 type:complete len:352 (-) Transcript_13261:103-1158(-)